MEKRRVGRPKKNNAVKPGQLKRGECRFTFITTLENMSEIKTRAKEEELTIKEYLNKILNHHWNRDISASINENKMRVYLNNQKKK